MKCTAWTALGRIKFTRQKPVAGFIADFACHDARLIVELDGGQHDLDVEKDERRTRIIEHDGWRVIRFWNSEIFESFDSVLQEIEQEANWRQ